MAVAIRVRRSGYQVTGTAFAAGAVSSLLAPWITAAVTRLSLATGVTLDAGYSDQLLGLTVAIVTWISSQVKMWWIEQMEQPPKDPPTDSPVPE